MQDTDLELINIGNLVDVYVPYVVLEILLNDVDGIHCAARLMDYDVEYTINSKRKDPEYKNALMSFYKGEDFLFELIFVFNIDTKIVSEILLMFDFEQVEKQKVEALATQFGLTLDIFNWISISLTNNESYDRKNVSSILEIIKNII